MEPIWIRQADAPKILGVSKTFFMNCIKPQLEPITLSSRCVVYDYIDLKKFCGKVKKLSSWAMKGGSECPTAATLLSSNLLEKTGGLTDTSTGQELDRVLAELKNKKIKQS